ncbi:DUF2946 domain-containing protein [Aquipseudomonas alcaligenes]|uniref:DUF2946 domain-containing protein n=1 Tax=Aquipseudomonas alcaligenes TaxID=43263 RepID=A0A1N6S2Q4_AQUAC|nr:DUF2946 domain-containing protein [Pseudomonas alcaligenes]SIQ35252.1 Protein of unknown function [Pseudomonas alcaligenes]
MKLSPPHRAATAWMLYLCILSNLVACALAHGQYAGLELSGIGGLYCSASGSSGAGFGDDLSGNDSAQLSSPFSCAVCGSAIVSLGLLFVLAWLLRIPPAPRPPHEPRHKAPPRYSWPSANPRASPLF